MTRVTHAVLAASFACVIWAVPSMTSAAPVLQINGSGILLGATGVDVNGTLYDVQFVDGPCTSHFNACNGFGDFDFTTEANALGASQALIDQVFIGAFDSLTTLIAGCSSTTSCSVLTPYATIGDLVAIGVAYNIAGEGADTAQGNHIGRTTNTVSFPNLVFADWGPDATLFTTQNLDVTTAPVPEPASLVLLGTGLAAAASAVRRRKKAQAD